MKLRFAWALLLGTAFAGLATLKADEPPKTDAPTLVVTDSAGKEHKLRSWRFTTDARRLAWLAKDKPTDAPEALELREIDSTNFAAGVVTLVPLDRLRSLEYDAKKETVKLTVATGPKADDKVTLNGGTGYKDTNRPTLEGVEGKATEKVKFTCGVEGGIKSAKFPAAKFEAQPLGRSSELTTRRNGNDPTTHQLGELQPLYRFADGKAILSPTLYCKTLKAEMAKVVRIKRTAGQEGEVVWIISRNGKDDETERVLQTLMIDGKEATLVGLVGRVPAGYKLIPALIVQEVEFDVK